MKTPEIKHLFAMMTCVFLTCCVGVTLPYVQDHRISMALQFLGMSGLMFFIQIIASLVARDD
jgi:hypothetical protein